MGLTEITNAISGTLGIRPYPLEAEGCSTVFMYWSDQRWAGPWEKVEGVAENRWTDLFPRQARCQSSIDAF